MYNRLLIIVRHGKSDWADPDLADIDRPLKSRGVQDSYRMAGRLKDRGLCPDLLIPSPATRAMSTAMIFARELGYDNANIRVMEELYHASPNNLVNIACHLPGDRYTVMLFGHNPGLTDFVNIYLKNRVDNIPTAGVVTLEFERGHWSDLHPSRLVAETVEFPKKK